MSSLARNTAFVLLMAGEEDVIRAVSTSLPDTPVPLTTDEAEKAQDRRLSDVGPGAPNPGWRDLLYYLDLGQKLDVLARHRERIAVQLAIDPSAIKTTENRLRSLISIRNRVCHARPLEEEDFPTVIDASRELMSETNFPFDNLAREYQRLRSNQYPFTITIPDFWKTPAQRVNNNLPAADFDDTGYIGRDQDRRNLTQLLVGNHPVITVTGEGGIGKTALTLRCLYDLLDRENNPYDAIVFSSLKTNRLTPAGIQTIVNDMANDIDVLRPVVDLVGDQLQGMDKAEVFDRVVSILELFHVLLVVDNLETIDLNALRPLLIRIPRDSKVVLTSRIGLGEIEIRYALSPMAAKDAVRLLRRLAKLLNVDDLVRRADQQLAEYCERLYFNPLVIRWFVQGYSEGKSVAELLNSRRSFDAVLQFCFQNVYERLDKLQRTILRTLVIAPGPLSEVQSAVLVGIADVDTVRSVLQYLHSSNLLKRKTDEWSGHDEAALWTSTEFARRFVNSNDAPPINERQRIIAEYRALIHARDQARTRSHGHSFSFNAIEAHTTDEATVVRLLLNARERAINREFAAALRLVEQAVGLQPNFYEVWRVSAQVKDLADNVAGAYEDFARALELSEGKSEPLLLFYSHFLRKHHDLDGGLELLRQHLEEGHGAPQLVAEYAWLHALSGKLQEAANIFRSLDASILNLNARDRGHYAMRYVATLRWAAELELGRDSLKLAMESAKDSLSVLARYCPVIDIDPATVQEGQACFQTAARILSHSCGPADWEALSASAKAVAQFFPLVGEIRTGTDALERRCASIASSKEYIELVQRVASKVGDTKLRLRGNLKTVYAGRDYGFIRGTDGVDYFVHKSAFRSAAGWESLWDRGPIPVEFAPQDPPTGSNKGPRAADVTLLASTRQ